MRNIVLLRVGAVKLRHKHRTVLNKIFTHVDTSRYNGYRLREIRKRKVNFKGERQR